MSLRLDLQKITDNFHVSEHAAAIDALKEKWSHSISSHESPIPTDQYTCLMHVSGFQMEADYPQYARAGYFAGADYAHWLLARGTLRERLAGDARPNDWVLYLDHGTFKHVGLLCPDERVISKWGTGLLYQHGLWEVPDSYGNTFGYFRALSLEQSWLSFQEYVDHIRSKEQRHAP